MSASPFRFQLALQGGGAKILAMLAAVEGIRKLQSEGRVQVTRIAGTSAGSVVAAMFAAGVDLGAARKDLQERLGPTIKQHFSPPSNTTLFWNLVLRGRPLWSEELLTRLLLPYFSTDGTETLGQLSQKSKMHIHIVASVLSDARKIVYSDAEPEKPVIAALLDSCAIPFCFRVWQSTGPSIVDGGLCENLPSDELLPHEKEDGPVLAIGFHSPWPGNQRNIKDFALALLDTAINNSVSRAKARLGLNRVCEIRTNLSTFDFAKAVEFSDHEATVIEGKATEFVVKFANDQLRGTLQGDPWQELNTGLMEGWWRIYQEQHALRTVGINHKTTMVVQAASLAADADDDSVSYQIIFEPLEEMFCSSLAIIPTEGSVSLHSSEIELMDQNGQSADFVLVPARDPSHPGKKPVVIYFTPSLKPGTGRYTLTLRQQVPQFMRLLRDKGVDELFVATRPSKHSVGRIDLVLHLPKEFKTARMVPRVDSGGRGMTKLELVNFATPVGYRTLGWCGEQVPPNTRFTCDVIRD